MTTQHDIADTITDLANLSPPEAGQAFTRLVAEKRLSLVMAEINRLQEKRQELMQRILGLPRFSHRRLELETRLKAITIDQLRIHQTIRRGHGQ